MRRRIEPLVGEMHPGRRRFEMTIVRGGLVTVDEDRELVLEEGKAKG